MTPADPPPRVSLLAAPQPRAAAQYDVDLAAWADGQARLLRAGNLAGADIEHIAEELEGLAISDRRALASQILRILVHLMKLDASPAMEPRAKWRQTVVTARNQIEIILEDNPSLRREIPGLVNREMQRARQEAEAALQKYGAETGKLAELAFTPTGFCGTGCLTEPVGLGGATGATV